MMSVCSVNEEKTEEERTRRFTSKPSVVFLRGVMAVDANFLLLVHLHDLRVLHRTLYFVIKYVKEFKQLFKAIVGYYY